MNEETLTEEVRDAGAQAVPTDTGEASAPPVQTETEAAPPENTPPMNDPPAAELPTSSGETLSHREAERSVPLPSPEAMRGHLAGLYRQAEELKADFPDFDLEVAMEEPEFLRLTSPLCGVSVRAAYCALHASDIARRAARLTEETLRGRLRADARRPREGGGEAARPALSPRGRSEKERQALRERIEAAAARGEKIYP